MRFVGIDPSTKTGLVILDENGKVLVEKEITSKVNDDPQRFMDLASKVIGHLNKLDFIVIEGFSYGSKGSAVSTQYGIGWLIRSELIRQGFQYIEVSPNGLKKFATGKGNAAKDDLVLPIFKRWGYEHKSNNVRDAFVLAQVARSINSDIDLTAFQQDVLKNISKG